MYRILLVDDEADTLDVLGLLFTLEGFHVQRAASGRDALELARSAPPDLVVTDVMMPEMDGVELCSHLRESERTRDVPVILSSAIHRVPEGRGTLFQAVVPKPIDIHALLQLVRTLLDHRRGSPGHG